MATGVLEQRDALVELSDSLDLALIALMEALPGDLITAREVLVDASLPLFESYGLAAGSMAADWYDDVRDAAGVAGAYSATVSVPAGFTDRAAANIRYAASPLTDEAGRGVVLSRLSGSAQRAMADHHRLTITDAADADPAAAGWARFGSGGSCAFCEMLIRRGAVYRRGTRFASHDHCNCLAGPSFESAHMVDGFAGSSRRLSKAARGRNHARVRAWINAHQGPSSAS